MPAQVLITTSEAVNTSLRGAREGRTTAAAQKGFEFDEGYGN